jgi:hypothetical protein
MLRQNDESNRGAGLHGSSLKSYGDALDGERAASMADEGGAAGAYTDAREQHVLAPLTQRGWGSRTRKALIWGGVALAFLGAFAFGFRRRWG